MKKPKNQTKSDIRKKAMIEALEKTLGVVTAACQITGFGRAQHYQWLKNDKEYKAQVESVEDIALDFAESKLHANIRDGDTTSIIFYLKTKGKKRGYSERNEIDLTTKGNEIHSGFTIEVIDKREQIEKDTDNTDI